MKMAFLDVKNGKELQVVDIADELKEYYRLIDCSTIDITMRKVGSTAYDIICDDEGLLKSDPIVSMISDKYHDKPEPMLVGNLLFAHHDTEGNMTGLTDEEIADIKDHEVKLLDRELKKSYTAVFGDYY